MIRPARSDARRAESPSNYPCTAIRAGLGRHRANRFFRYRAGYMAIEGMTFRRCPVHVGPHSLVGFGEVTALSPIGRLFTIVLIVTGVGMVIYLLTEAAELVLEGTLRESFGRSVMEKRIQSERTRDHLRIRLGKAVVEELEGHDGQW